MSREQRQQEIAAGQAGFTLLEFLIAATLMALMGAAVFGSLTVALNSYAQSQERMDEEGRQRVLEDMVRHQLGSLYPLVPSLRLSTGNTNPMQGQMPGLTPLGVPAAQNPLQASAPLFYGSSSALTFVTVAPFEIIRNPGLTVVRYGHAEDEWGDRYFGAMETRYRGPETFYQMVEVPEGEPIPIIKNVKDLYFEYYGFDPQTGIGEWYAEWSTLDTLAVPGAIRITADDLKIVIVINTTSGPAAGTAQELRKLFSGDRPT